MVIVAAASPLDPPDFDEWYRKEHCSEISKCPGYRRTRRYKLTYARQNRLPDEEKQLAEPPTYLAMVSGEPLSVVVFFFLFSLLFHVGVKPAALTRWTRPPPGHGLGAGGATYFLCMTADSKACSTSSTERRCHRSNWIRLLKLSGRSGFGILFLTKKLASTSFLKALEMSRRNFRIKTLRPYAVVLERRSIDNRVFLNGTTADCVPCSSYCPCFSCGASFF
jgi:hypothetical protein